MSGDYCPDMGTCERCERPLCWECGGDSEPWDCLDGSGLHCSACTETCPSCRDALDDAAVAE